MSVIDDRSQDQTASVATAIAEQCRTTACLRVVPGTALPSGWVGKVWALQQGAVACGFEQDSNEGLPDYLLLTDADIWHAPDSLRCLVMESEDTQLALNSGWRVCAVCPLLSACLSAVCLLFYPVIPLALGKRSRKKTAASAGGCVLLSAQALIRIGGFQALRDQLIDDVTLGRLVKGVGLPIRLSLSRTAVKSLRIYDTVDSIWSMVRRTAFTSSIIPGSDSLALLSVWPSRSAPSIFFLCGLALFGLPSIVDVEVSAQLALLLMLEGGLAWGLMTTVYLPGVRFFDLSRVWGFGLPLAAMLYEAMTLDSAFRHLRKKRLDWR